MTFEQILKQVRDNKIKEVNLKNNRIGHQGAEELAEALKNNISVTSLNLAGCQIGPKGAKYLSEALKASSSISLLNLDGNYIENTGVKELSEALKVNNSLKSLELRSNDLGTSSAKYLGEALKINSSLTKINLGDFKITIDYFHPNNIGTAGAKHLLEALQTNTTLLELRIDDNRVGQEILAKINAVLSQRNSASTVALTTTSTASSTSIVPEESILLTENNKKAKSSSIAELPYQSKNKKTKSNIKLPEPEQPKPIIEPEPETPVANPVQDLIVSKSWHFSPELKEQKAPGKIKSYQLLEASTEDVQKVISFYQHHPVPGMDIKSIQIIFNPQLNRGFEAKLYALQGRNDSQVFNPTWQQGENDNVKQRQWRAHIHSLYFDMAKSYTDSDYPDVKLLPLWHGTKSEALESIFKTGYANLAHTDSGFFGKGIYSTHEAEYAYRVYSNGALIVNWIASYSAFPTIDGDMSNLVEKGNYKNYDAHFVPVVAKTANPMEVNYYPTKPNQQHTYTEVVVFDSSQCLPRYLVELQPALPKSVSTNTHGFFNKNSTSIDLKATQHYVYEQYLSKPYTLKESTDGKIDFTQVDWEYRDNNTLIHRPNHGLAHTLRCAAYVEQVVEYYIEHHNNLSKSIQNKLKQSASEIQLRLLFEIVGRENEAARLQDEEAWDRFFENSSKAFREYVKSNHIKLRYYHDEALSTHIQSIRRVAHVIDLLRCLTKSQCKDKWNEVAGHVGFDNCQKLQKLAYYCLVSTGDRMIDYKGGRDYEGNRFIKASQDVDACMQLIQEGIKVWQDKYSFIASNQLSI